MPALQKLYRSDSKWKLGGVYAGIHDYYDIDPMLVRLAFTMLVLQWGLVTTSHLAATRDHSRIYVDENNAPVAKASA